MNIKQFIQSQIILHRIKHAGVLVVYDPDHRYQELCQGQITIRLQPDPPQE